MKHTKLYKFLESYITMKCLLGQKEEYDLYELKRKEDKATIISIMYNLPNGYSYHYLFIEKYIKDNQKYHLYINIPNKEEKLKEHFKKISAQQKLMFSFNKEQEIINFIQNEIFKYEL